MELDQAVALSQRQALELERLQHRQRELSSSRASAELIDAQKHIGDLELQLATQSSEMERAVIEHETSLHKVQQALQQAESRLALIQATPQSNPASNRAYEDAIRKATERARAAESGAIAANTKAQGSAVAVRRLEGELERMRDALESEKALVGQLKSAKPVDDDSEEVAALKRRLVALQTQLGESQVVQADPTRAHLVAQLEQARQIQRQSESLRKENVYLRGVQHTNELQREQIASMRTRLEIAERAALDAGASVARVTALESERVAWIERLNKLGVVHTTPEALLDALESERHQVVLQTAQQGSLVAKVRALETEVQGNDKVVNLLREQRAKFEEQLMHCQKQNVKIEKTNSELQRERDSLRRLLSSYEQDGSDSNASQRVAEALEQLAVAEGRADALAKELASTQQSLTAAQTRLHDAQLSADVSGAIDSEDVRGSLKRARTDAPNRDLQSENERLQRELDDARTVIADAERRLGRGEFDGSTTKVLHLRMNPATMASNTSVLVANLRHENEELRVRVEELEKHSEVAAVEAPVADLELDQLRSGIRTAELRTQRLKEVFRGKIQEFREACYLLMGFRIDMLGRQYRLRSMFAERESDHLLFQSTDSGGLELLETDFSRRLDVQVKGYLSTCHSIPGFLASVTLDLFNKQTFA